MNDRENCHDFISRMKSSIPTEPEGDARAHTLDEDLLRTLALAREEIGPFSATCNKPGGEFKSGTSYAICHITHNGVCLVHGENHVGLRRAVFGDYFVFMASPARMEAIRAVVADVSLRRMETLRKVSATYVKPAKLKVGQTVRWKEGLASALVPVKGEHAVVLGFPDEVVSGDADARHNAEVLDVQIGAIDDGGNFVTFLADSRRLESCE